MFIHEDYLEDELLPLELQKFQNFQPKSTSWISGPKQNFGGPSPFGLVQNFALYLGPKYWLGNVSSWLGPMVYDS